MYSYVFDAETRGYLLTTHNEKYVASEIRPVFAPELTLTGLDRYFKPKSAKLKHKINCIVV